MQTLLADTNILQYGIKPEYAAQTADVFKRLVPNYELTISAFTTFEVYRGLEKSRIPRVKQLIDLFTAPIEVDLSVLKIGAMLTTCYKTHIATKSQFDRYNEGDVIIAACAMRTGAYILTANGNDFPRPFFSEVENMTITNTKKGSSITLQILAPDIACFNQIMQECYNTNWQYKVGAAV